MKTGFLLLLLGMLGVMSARGIESITGDPLQVARAFSRSLALEQRFVERVDWFADRYRNRPGDGRSYPGTLLGGSILYFGLEDVPVIYLGDEVDGGVNYLATEAYLLWQDNDSRTTGSRYWIVAGTAGAVYEPYINLLGTSARIEEARETEDVYLFGGGYRDWLGITVHGSTRSTLGLGFTTLGGVTYRTRFSDAGEVEAQSAGLDVAALLGRRDDWEGSVQIQGIGSSLFDPQALETSVAGGVRLPLEELLNDTPLWVRGYTRLTGDGSVSGTTVSLEYGGSFDNPTGTWEHLHGRRLVHYYSVGVGASYTGRDQPIGGYRIEEPRTGVRAYFMYATIAGIEVSLNYDSVLQEFPEFRDRGLVRFWVSIR